MFGGDIIRVPHAGVVFVDGAVKKPGVFNLYGRNNLVQAVAMAGGMSLEANRSEVQILRMRTDGYRDVITVDYDKTLTGSQEYLIKDSDIVIVPKSGWKTLVSGLLYMMRGTVAFTGNPAVSVDVGQPWGQWMERW